MSTRVNPRVIVALVFVTLASSCLAQSSDVVRVEIESTWGGLGEPSRSRFVIEAREGSFFVRGRPISSATVDALLEAIDSESPGSSKLSMLGATPIWLHENALLALQESFPPDLDEEVTPRQRELFVDSFRDYRFAERAVAQHATGGGTDDFPEVRLRIVRSDGQSRMLRSHGNGNFLYVWAEEQGGELYNRTSGAISRALWELLPSDFTNRSRLSERALRREVAIAILAEIKDHWDVLEVEDRIGVYLHPIEERFSIEKSAISSLLSIDLDGRESWNATLKSATLPGQARIGISLPIRDEKLVGVDDFLKTVDEYTSLALSPSWFRGFLAEHPGAEVEIRFVENRSLSAKALERLTADLGKSGHGQLAESIKAMGDKVVFVELHSGTWSRWVVLPSQDMVLWEFQGNSVGNWSTEDFQFQDCNGWKCVGELISSNGQRGHQR